MSSLGFWIVTVAGGTMLLYSIVIYTHSYRHDRKLHNPSIIFLFAVIGFALISTPHWDNMRAGTPKYGFAVSREQQEREVKGMEVFVSTSKPSVDKLPPGTPAITIFNNFYTSLQEFLKKPDTSKFYDLRNEYVGTSTGVYKAIETYKIIDLTEGK